MTRHSLEVADVFREYESEFKEKYWTTLSVDQKRAFRAIMACRTETLGGHIEQCDKCGQERNAYNSCRNRHCPKCQAMARAKWMQARAEELLPIPYFHVVFTLPRQIGRMAMQNQKIIYGILFRAAAETLKELSADPKHLGAEIGILSVLHTWGQTLAHHPHLHCVISGGGTSPDGKRWIDCKSSNKNQKSFFIHHKIISRKFRGKFIDLLKLAYRKGELSFYGDLINLRQIADFEQRLNEAVRKDWVVHLKEPFGEPKIVLKYLARYTHRVAISNHRLVDMRDGMVRFWYKDYANGNEKKIQSLKATEFIRRFLLHIVPSGFMRIRHSGFLANRFRKIKLEVCRKLLGIKSDSPNSEDEANLCKESTEETALTTSRCPFCNQGQMFVIAEIPHERDKPVASTMMLELVPSTWPP